MEEGIGFEYSAPVAPVIRPRARPFRWLKRLAVGLSILSLVLAAGATIIRWVSLTKARARTGEIVARLDRLDPGWRFEEIEAARKVIPDARNSGIPIIAAFRLLPKGWPGARAATPGRDRRLHQPRSEEHVVDNLIELGVVFRPDEAQLAVIRTELDALKPALTEARKVAELDEGRFALEYARDPFQTLLTNTQNSRDVARLLKLDAIRRALDGDADGALVSCRALLNVGRSIGDEPFAISQLVRNANQFVALRSLEFVLDSAEPSDDELAAVQRLLEAEDGVPQLRQVCRGERAMLNDYYARVVAGEIPVAKGTEVPGPMWWLWGEWMCIYAWGEILEEMNQAVAIADKTTISGLRERWKAWERGISARASADSMGKFSRLMLPAITPLVDSIVMSRARLRAALVAVAAERHRRKHGDWPESADQLTPWPLARVPADPCTEAPLIWRRDEGTLAIYSTGPDLADDDGALEQDDHVPASGAKKPPPGQPYWQDKDFGFRLRDAASRRLSPAPTQTPH